MTPRRDAALRAQAPAAVLELLAAYEMAAKRTVTLDHQRARALSEIAERGYTGDDITMVVQYVRRLARRPKTHGMTHGFSDASIGFQNLLLDVNKFEDRILEAREAIIQLRTMKGRRVERATLDCGGGVKTLVEKETTPAQKSMQEITRRALLDLAEGLAR